MTYKQKYPGFKYEAKYECGDGTVSIGMQEGEEVPAITFRFRSNTERVVIQSRCVIANPIELAMLIAALQARLSPMIDKLNETILSIKFDQNKIHDAARAILDGGTVVAVDAVLPEKE